MSNEHSPVPIDPELNAVAAELMAITPARSRLDRDRVMFLAGQASRPASGGRRFWHAAAACLGLIASAEAALLAHRPAPRVVEKIVVVREPAAPIPEVGEVDRVPDPFPVLAEIDISLGRSARERMAAQVLRYGLDGLPAPPTGRWSDAETAPIPSRQSLREQIRQDLDLGDPS